MTMQVGTGGVVLADQLLLAATATGTKTLAGTLPYGQGTVSASIVLTPDPASSEPGSDLTVVVEYQG